MRPPPHPTPSSTASSTATDSSSRPQPDVIHRPARPGLPACYLRLPIGTAGPTGSVAPTAPTAPAAPARPPHAPHPTDSSAQSSSARGKPIPLVVCVHGIAIDAEEQIRLLSPFADRHAFALLAPVFEPGVWSDYQRLGRRGRGPRADLALQALIDDCASELGFRVGEIFLIGYSGGAQFVHRYVLAHPSRATAVVAAAAGWYTPPDPRRAYPHGLRIDGSLAGVQIEPADLHRCPILVCVGDRDVARDESVRCSPRLDRVQGMNRRERARRWVDDTRRAARRLGIEPRVSLLELPDVGHSFAQCMEAGLGEAAFRFFEESRKESKP